MKDIIGCILIIAGAVLGIYVGVWVCFVGGIVDVIEQIRSVDLSAMAIAWGVAKIFFAGLFGWISALVFVLPGVAMLED